MKKVLIVEDEAPLRGALSQNLSKYFEVIAAKNGREGLDKAREFVPDLILLDMILPEMVGVEVLSSIRESDWGKKIPVIALTNLTDINMEMKSRELGVESYLIKSNVSLPNLIKDIQKILHV